jgi:hypothetical protein
MDRQYLSSDESVILTTQMIVINGMRHEAVFTSRRIILVDSTTKSIKNDIPFASIGLAVAGENTLREPTITLSINTPDGETQSVELVFIRRFIGQNFDERDKCIDTLRDRNVPTRMAAPRAPRISLRQAAGEISGSFSGEKPAIHPPAQEWAPTIFPYTLRQAPPDEPPERLIFRQVAVVILVFAVIAGGVIFYGQFIKGKPSSAIKPVNGSAPSNATAPPPFPVPTILETPSPAASPVPGSLSERIIPENGVWVRVQYPGNYVGYIGAQGIFKQINSSGEQLVQLPVISAMVEGSLEKQDGSKDNLIVDVYRDGTLVASSNTTTPHGVVDVHVAL